MAAAKGVRTPGRRNTRARYVDKIPQRRYVTCDDRDPSAPGLEDHDRAYLVQGRKHNHIRRADPVCHRGCIDLSCVTDVDPWKGAQGRPRSDEGDRRILDRCPDRGRCRMQDVGSLVVTAYPGEHGQRPGDPKSLSRRLSPSRSEIVGRRWDHCDSIRSNSQTEVDLAIVGGESHDPIGPPVRGAVDRPVAVLARMRKPCAHDRRAHSSTEAEREVRGHVCGERVHDVRPVWQRVGQRSAADCTEDPRGGNACPTVAVPSEHGECDIARRSGKETRSRAWTVNQDLPRPVGYFKRLLRTSSRRPLRDRNYDVVCYGEPVRELRDNRLNAAGLRREAVDDEHNPHGRRRERKGLEGTYPQGRVSDTCF